MPKRKRRYILTATAERDFREARRWSRSRWGTELTRQYFADLHEGAEWIARNHHSLPERVELTGTSGLGVHPVREHYVLYVPIGKHQIAIVAMIRQTRDVPAILTANGYLVRRQLREIFDKLDLGEIPNLPQRGQRD